MLPFNFRYSKPTTAQEAVGIFENVKLGGAVPFYFSGGTELITLGRIGLDYADAVIDLKGIPGYEGAFSHDKYLVIGGGTTLTSISEHPLFPLLSKTVSEIADRTARNKITLAGNICGKIFYREAVLPLLLTDCLVGVFGRDGLSYKPILTVFNQNILLKDGDFVFNILIEKDFATLPYFTQKRRKQWDVGYPLITLAALKKDGEIRMAISGLCPFPFRSSELESVLNEQGPSVEERAERAMGALPSPILDDVEGSSEFRKYVLKNMMADAIRELEGKQDGSESQS
ncbi:xanthine dehydrogenase [Neobacillus notoginsengisoli]|uniref:Xanthine dehydrogenase n=1 Tax=Neobacillus notoginsengisoli TaxID=1578198 RepID=A0A417YSI5_9BACI|nr:FAD binding domain-containing protein [Neobacillus notoginsengisoli]RHW38954.1 xanthine dehydrogenase [Neobacillus notoginsengisoli]